MHDAADSPAVPDAHRRAGAALRRCSRTAAGGGQALLFEEPEEIIVARASRARSRRRSPAWRRRSKRGLYLAGYASYELGYALEPKFATQTTPRSRTPLLLFGAFRAPRPCVAAARREAAPEHSR